MTNFVCPVNIGKKVYCLIDDDVVSRKCIGYTNNGEDFQIITDKNEELVFGLEAFETLVQANNEIKNRLYFS